MKREISDPDEEWDLTAISKKETAKSGEGGECRGQQR